MEEQKAQGELVTNDNTHAQEEVQEEQSDEDSPVKGPKEQRFKAIDQETLPPTYRQNSQREELLLDYANMFETQFLTQFPQHKPLHICPMNEGMIPKFLPTTLRPALLADSSLMNANVLAKFVAQSIDYEPFADPTQYSIYQQCPQTTLEFQKGDSLDISMLLCSLLLGAGYNAFVVLGAADRFLTCQMTNKQNMPELDELRTLSGLLLADFAAQAAFSKKYRTGLFMVPQEFSRQFDDFGMVEQQFTRQQIINHPKFFQNPEPEIGMIFDVRKYLYTTKEVQNLYFRPDLNEVRLLGSINIQENEVLDVHKLLNNSYQYKNLYSFDNVQVLKHQGQESITGYRFALTGSGQFISANDINYNASLLCLPPNETAGCTLANRYVRKRPVKPESTYEKTKAMRKKMERIGAKPLDVETVIIEQMRRANLLEDILVPGETGQQRQQEEISVLKKAAENEQQHISELSQDILDGERVYAWVYIAPIESQMDGQKPPPGGHKADLDINGIVRGLVRPGDVQTGCFVDAVSGTVYSLGNKLFKRVDSIFNDQNYYVNLQNEAQPGPGAEPATAPSGRQLAEFDIYNIDHWCICVMTRQITALREKQLKYHNQYEIEEELMKLNGGKHLYIKEYKNQVSGLHQGTELPDSANRIISGQIKDVQQKAYNESLQANPITSKYELVNKQPITHLQDKYVHRWDYVKPVRMLMSSLPAAWPVQTTLDELKIRQNYPLRPKNEYEFSQRVPEKTYLFRDAFVRLFNQFSQQNGCVAIIATRPRPVYRSVFDGDGDCVKNKLVEWRFIRHLVYKSRTDQLGCRSIQYSIKYDDIYEKPNEDVYKQLNDGLELITKLDTVEVDFNGKKYPLWCFLGDDLDEFKETEASVNANIMFNSFSHDYFCQVENIKYIFNPNRSDQLKSLEIYKNGLRRCQFYECRQDGLGQMVVDNLQQQIVEKYYDYLRQDGLQQRILKYSLVPIVSQDNLRDQNTDNIQLQITQFNEQTKTYEQISVYLLSLEEKFRNVGSIRQTLNSRRRKFIDSRKHIQDCEIKFLTGLKSENQTETEENSTAKRGASAQVGQMAPIENEDQYTNLDFFQEIEYALTIAAFQVFNQQKQLFQTNISSVSNPMYNIQNGSQTILNRHHSKLLQAYNLCPDKEMLEYQQLQQQQQLSQTVNQTMNSQNNMMSNMSSTEIENSQLTSDDEGGVQAGPQFWRRRAKKLKNENSQVTTSFLKMDIQDLTKMKNAQLPKNMHTLQILSNNAISQATLTENEMKRQNLSLYVSQAQFYDMYFYNIDPQFNNAMKSQEFSQEFCVQQIKTRELPILTPIFDSAPQAYQYVAQYLNQPIRFQKIFYNLAENAKQIRCLRFNDDGTMVQQVLLFDQQLSTCHFLKVVNQNSDNTYVINQQVQMNAIIYKNEEEAIINQINEQYMQKQLRTQPNKVPVRMPLQNLNNNNHLNKFRQKYQFFQAESCDYSGGSGETVTSLQISDFHVHLFAREKMLISGSDNPFIKNNENYFTILNSVQNNVLTKLPGDQRFQEQAQYGNSLNIFHQNVNKGLHFTPRQLLLARQAECGINQPVYLQTEPKTVEVKKVSNNDFLLPFIPKQYRELDVLPSDIAKQVYEDAMSAMKKRILDRTGYIQSRLAAETANLRKNNKNLEQLNAEEKERVMKDIKDSIFRIRIIEMRTLKHIDDGTKRFAQYGEELKKDPRLADMQFTDKSAASATIEL